MPGAPVPDRPALVTGASGVVGRALVAHLLASGWPVRGLVRSEAAEARLREAGGEPVRGHLLDPDSLRRAAEGCAFVFHVAGLNAYCQQDSRALFEINVRGSLNMLRAAEAAGVRRFVHTSSAVTIGEPRGTIGREDSPHRGFFLSDYERAKHEAELAVLSERTPVEVVVVNPASVQGPGRIEGTGQFLFDLIAGRLRFLVNSRIDIVEIEDCAVGHRLAAERGQPGERYLLSGFAIEMRALVSLIESITGIERSPIWIPPAFMPAAGHIVGGLERLLGRNPRLCPETVRNLLHGAAYDGSRATRELGLTYRGAEETFRRLIAWYAREGWLEAPASSNRAQAPRAARRP